MSFYLHKRSDPCPICDSTDGRCKTKETGLLLCMTFPDPDSIEAWRAAGYQYIGRTKNGMWGSGVRDDRIHSDSNYKVELQRQRQQRLEAERQRKATAMQPAERDKHYRRLLASLSLHPGDRADLHRRGFTDQQIEQAGFKSVDQWQRLDQEFPLELAGTGINGRSLIVPQAGYLCPIRDIDGLIVAFQIRAREAGDGGRYRWLTSATKKRPNGPTPHLPNGELPLAIYQPTQVERPGELWIVEGTGAKPFLACDRLGVPVVGAAGGQHAGSPEQLQQALERFQPTTVVIASDANPNKHVYQRYQAVYQHCKDLGYRVAVAWWGQMGESASDVDELADLAQIKLISFAEFGVVTGFAQRQPGEPDPTAYQQFVIQISARDRAEQAEVSFDLRQGFLGLYHKVKAKLYRSKAEGFKHPEPRITVGGIPQFKTQAEGYLEGIRRGAKLIVNKSGTGTGKDYFAARTTPEFWGTERVISVQPDALNPQDQAYHRDWAVLEGRHLGNIDVDGKVRRATIDTPELEKTLTANCEKAHAIATATAKNPVNPIYKLACSNCRHNWRCGTERGDGYGAKFEAAQAWQHRMILTSYGRLPRGNGEEAGNLANATLILNEASSHLKLSQETEISQADNDATTSQILRKQPELWPQLQLLLTYLRERKYQTLEGFDKRYGIDYAGIAGALKALLPEDLDWDALHDLEDGSEELKLFGLEKEVKLTNTERSRIATLEKKRPYDGELDWRRSWLENQVRRNEQERDELRKIRKSRSWDEEKELTALSQKQEEAKRRNLNQSETLAAAKDLPLRWLVDFCSVILGYERGHIHIKGDGTIVLSLRNQDVLDTIAAAKRVVVTDASETSDRNWLAKKYGVDPEEIFIFEVIPSKQAAQLETIQVTGLGSLSKNRGQQLEQCRRAGVTALKRRDPTHKTFDWKGFEQDGVLFRDSTGSNDYQGCGSISTTLPRPNMGAVLAEYCLLTGEIVNEEDEGFKRYYNDKVAELLIQVKGRLRAEQRPGESLQFYVFCDGDLPIECDRTIAAWEICPEAARKGDRTILNLANVAKGLLEQGIELTQSALARAAAAIGQNVSRQYVSHVWDRVQLFLINILKKSCTPPDGSLPEPEQVELDIQLIEDLAATNRPEYLDEVWMSALEPGYLAYLWHRLTRQAQTVLLQSMLSCAPPSFLEELT